MDGRPQGRILRTHIKKYRLSARPSRETDGLSISLRHPSWRVSISRDEPQRQSDLRPQRPKRGTGTPGLMSRENHLIPGALQCSLGIGRAGIAAGQQNGRQNSQQYDTDQPDSLHRSSLSKRKKRPHIGWKHQAIETHLRSCHRSTPIPIMRRRRLNYRVLRAPLTVVHIRRPVAPCTREHSNRGEYRQAPLVRLSTLNVPSQASEADQVALSSLLTPIYPILTPLPNNCQLEKTAVFGPANGRDLGRRVIEKRPWVP